MILRDLVKGSNHLCFFFVWKTNIEVTRTDIHREQTDCEKSAGQL